MKVSGEEFIKDKLAFLHKQWKREDDLKSCEDKLLVERQHQQCKEVSIAMFRFEL